MSSAYLHALNGTLPATWRETPPGQPTVPELVKEDMEVRTSYGTGGIVVAVRGPYTRFWEMEHPACWTIIFVFAQHYGAHGEVAGDAWRTNPKLQFINNVVAVDGRLLNLCTDDETFIVRTAPATPIARNGQLGLSL